MHLISTIKYFNFMSPSGVQTIYSNDLLSVGDHFIVKYRLNNNGGVVKTY